MFTDCRGEASSPRERRKKLSYYSAPLFEGITGARGQPAPGQLPHVTMPDHRHLAPECAIEPLLEPPDDGQHRQGRFLAGEIPGQTDPDARTIDETHVIAHGGNIPHVV